MDKHQSIARIKQAISEGLEDSFEPEVFVRPSHVGGLQSKLLSVANRLLTRLCCLRCL